MKVGSHVRIKPTTNASDDFRQKVTALGNVVGRVGAISSAGVCTVLLPGDVKIQGYSHPLTDNSNYIDIHQEHLELA